MIPAERSDRTLRACLASIRRLPRASYHLRVAAGGVTDVVRKHLLRLRRRGDLDALHLAPLALDRTTLIQRLLRDELATDFVWLMDDTARIPHPRVLHDALAVADGASGNTVLWTATPSVAFPVPETATFDVAAQVRSAPWYRGRPIGPSSSAVAGDPASPRNTGWLARTRALRALGWPDVGVPGFAHDWMLTEAIRQQGWHCGRLPAM